MKPDTDIRVTKKSMSWYHLLNLELELSKGSCVSLLHSRVDSRSLISFTCCWYKNGSFLFFNIFNAPVSNCSLDLIFQVCVNVVPVSTSSPISFSSFQPKCDILANIYIDLGNYVSRFFWNKRFFREREPKCTAILGRVTWFFSLW